MIIFLRKFVIVFLVIMDENEAYLCFPYHNR